MPDSLTGQDDGKVADAPEDVKVAQPAEGEAKTAEASVADGKDEGPKSVLDAVKEAMKPEKAEGSSPSEGEDQGSEAKPGEQKPEEEAELGEPTDEELAGYHSKTRRRMKWLLDKRKEATDEVVRLKPAADGWNQLQGYMTDAKLAPDEVNQGFDVMRLMKNSPEKAIPLLEGYLNQLKQVVGDVLPADLKQAVEAGDISEQHARELSRARSSAAMANHASVEAAETAQRLQAQQGFERHATEVTRVVNEWDAKTAASDPDYALKRDRVMEKVKLALHENGFPRTTQAAVDLANKAKKEVDEEFKKFAPVRPQIKPVTTGAGAPPAKREPTTMREAIEAAVGK